MKTYKARIVGDSPLLMHSCAGLDKFNPLQRELAKFTSKRNKTDDDLLEIKRLEWHMGLYLDPDGVVSIPADNLLAVIVKGAQKAKLGKLASAAVFETKSHYALIYDGPKKPDALYSDSRFVDYRPVGVQKARVMRSRPIFRQWSADISLNYDESILNKDDLAQALKVAGEQIGIGDFRPRFGRFHIEK